MLHANTFQIKKCGSLTCNICKPPHLLQAVFEQIKFLPDPMPGEEGHYEPFSEVYGATTTEEHCPSSTKKPKHRKTAIFIQPETRKERGHDA